MIHYTPDQIFDLLEPENITCARDVKELSDYVFANLSHYDNECVVYFFKLLEILKGIHKVL
jgi:hypothetical protein